MMTDEQQLARCAEVATKFKALNPAMVFAYNKSCVVHVQDRWKLSMICSWAINGHFVNLIDKPLDVTGYVDRDSLKFAALPAEPVSKCEAPAAR